MAYEVFNKKKERIKKDDQPLMVAMDKQGRLMIKQSFFKIIETHSFKKAEILIDYENKKIGLRMINDDKENGSSIKKLIFQLHRTRASFISFISVKKALNLTFPFVRHATWNSESNILEFTYITE